MRHEVISCRDSFARSPAGPARHSSSSFFLLIIVRKVLLRDKVSSSYLVGEGQAELDLFVVAKSVSDRAPSGAARDSTGRGRGRLALSLTASA